MQQSRKRSREDTEFERELICARQTMYKHLKSDHDDLSVRVSTNKRKSESLNTTAVKRRKLINVPTIDLQTLQSCLRKLVHRYKQKNEHLTAETNKNNRLLGDNYRLQRRVYELEQALNFKRQYNEAVPSCREPWITPGAFEDTSDSTRYHASAKG